MKMIQRIKGAPSKFIRRLHILCPLPVIDYIGIVGLTIEDHVNASSELILFRPHFPLCAIGDEVMSVLLPEVHELAPLRCILHLLRNQMLRAIQKLLNG